MFDELQTARSLFEADRLFELVLSRRVDDFACSRYLAQRRWGPTGFQCEQCGHSQGTQLRTRPRVFHCQRCGRQRSVTAGTALHKTQIPLYDWFVMAASVKIGFIAMAEVARRLGRPYDTCFRIFAKIRAALAETPDPDRLGTEAQVVPFRAYHKKLPREAPRHPWSTFRSYTLTQRIHRGVSWRGGGYEAITLDREVIPCVASDWLAFDGASGSFRWRMACHRLPSPQWVRCYVDMWVWTRNYPDDCVIDWLVCALPSPFAALRRLRRTR